MGKLDFFFVDTKATVSHTFEDGPLEGETIFLREMITYGEQLDIRASALVGIRDDEGKQTFIVDSKKRQMAEMKTWLLTWSLESRDGEQKKVTAKKIEGLHPRAAAAIGEHIDEYVKEQIGEFEDAEEIEDPKSPAALTSFGDASPDMGG